jgi:hypothetical protein
MLASLTVLLLLVMTFLVALLWQKIKEKIRKTKEGNTQLFPFPADRFPSERPAIIEDISTIRVQQIREICATPRALHVGDVLGAIADQNVQPLSKAVTGTVKSLSSLYDSNRRAYDAVLEIWREDLFALCQELDSSTLSDAIADFACQELSLELSKGFSFGGMDSVRELDLRSFIESWQVPDEKYDHFWPYVDTCARSVFLTSGLAKPLKFVPIVQAAFAASDDFYDWGHLDFSWATFLGSILIAIAPSISNQKETVPFAVAAIVAGSAFMAYHPSTKKKDEDKIDAEPRTEKSVPTSGQGQAQG